MFTEEQREDLLVTCIEGGSNYWALFQEMPVINPEELETPYSIRVCQFINVGHKIDIFDVEDHEKHLGFISLQSIEEGEIEMKKSSPEHYADVISGNWDVETADNWLNYIVFGKIVYG